LHSIPTPAEKKTLRQKLFGNSNLASPSTVKVPTDGLNKLNKEIHQIKDRETRKEQEANTTLIQLQQKSKTLSLAITSGFAYFEKGILDNLEQEAEKASNSSKTISYVLIIFSVLVASLIAIALYSIYLYISKNNAYNKELEVAKVRSDELVQTKERFLANMSHEIRTPLNAISGFASLLAKEKMDPKQKEKVDIIHQSSHHLTELINQILDLTKLQSNKMIVENTAFNLATEVSWISKIMENEVEKRNNKFSMQVGEAVPNHLIGDPMKLKQIILNLCSNAIKFTENGMVELNIQSVQLNNQEIELRLKVSDTGIGISQEKQATIFDEFEQAETSTQRQYGGTGLGLSITKKLVELMKGKLYLQSEMGKGTTISVHLPFSISDKEINSKTLVSKSEFKLLKGKNILIVDDEPFNRKLLSTLLQQQNVFTNEAINGQEAIEKIQQDHYDIVFMDLRMPVMDGITAVKIIRKELMKSKDELVIIGLTANAQMVDEQTYLNAGFNAYMEKPFTEDKLIEALLKKHPMPDEIDELPLFDLTNLKQLSNGDGEFFEEMISSFIETTLSGMKDLNKLSKAKDWNNVAEIAHKIASPCSHLEAKKMHELLRTIENNSREMKDISVVKKKIEELNQVVELIVLQMSKETGIIFKPENN
ncbi:MAG: response regulator, partial [Bacteroidetes bacterium]|nr:response regulator [Bacteroidota bacterium]